MICIKYLSKRKKNFNAKTFFHTTTKIFQLCPDLCCTSALAEMSRSLSTRLRLRANISSGVARPKLCCFTSKNKLSAAPRKLMLAMYLKFWL